jgi:hypothetical protein
LAVSEGLWVSVGCGFANWTTNCVIDVYFFR